MSYKLPPVTHGDFKDTRIQIYTGGTSGQSVFLDTSFDANSGIVLSGETKFIVSSSGDYLINGQMTFGMTGGTNTVVEVWLEKNLNLVTNSTIRATIKDSNNVLTLPISYIIDMLANDYIEFKWYCGGASPRLVSYPIGATPTRPLTASVNLLINKISE